MSNQSDMSSSSPIARPALSRSLSTHETMYWSNLTRAEYEKLDKAYTEAIRNNTTLPKFPPDFVKCEHDIRPEVRAEAYFCISRQERNIPSGIIPRSTPIHLKIDEELLKKPVSILKPTSFEGKNNFITHKRIAEIKNEETLGVTFAEDIALDERVLKTHTCYPFIEQKDSVFNPINSRILSPPKNEEGCTRFQSPLPKLGLQRQNRINYSGRFGNVFG